MRIVKKNRFKNLGELHKEWTEAGVKASRATTHRRVKEFGYSCRQRHLTWAKEKKNWAMSFFTLPLDSRTLVSKWEQVLYFICESSVMIWGSMSSAGVGPLCFLKTNVTAPVYQEILEHFMLPAADQLFKDADFIFQQDLPPAHNNTTSTESRLNDQVCLTGQQTHQTWTQQRIYGVFSRGKCKQETKKCNELKATVKESWASIPPQQCHKLITSMPRRIEEVIKAKGALTKYWEHI